MFVQHRFSAVTVYVMRDEGNRVELEKVYAYADRFDRSPHMQHCMSNAFQIPTTGQALVHVAIELVIQLVLPFELHAVG